MRKRDKSRAQLKVDAALKKLRLVAMCVSKILDDGRRDPTWQETQELEEATLRYGRALRELNWMPLDDVKLAEAGGER